MDLALLSIVHFGGFMSQVYMTEDEARAVAEAWGDFTRKYKGIEDEQIEEKLDPICKIRGKPDPTSTKIVDWYVDFREVQLVSVLTK